MKLAVLYRHRSDLLDGLLALFSPSSPFCEDERQLSWPQSWSDEVMASPKMIKWLKSIGANGAIGKPMQGGVGRAYPVGDSFIIKFTTDQKEAQAAAVLRGHDSAHAADVYGVHRVAAHDKGGRRVNLYAIAMQRLNTGTSGKIRAAANAVYEYLNNYSGFIEDPEAVIRVVMAKYLDKKSRHDRNMESIVRKVVMALYDIQTKTGVLSQDPHGGNVAFKGREPAFFDFGRSSMDLDHPKAAGARITSIPE